MPWDSNGVTKLGALRSGPKSAARGSRTAIRCPSGAPAPVPLLQRQMEYARPPLSNTTCGSSTNSEGEDTVSGPDHGGAAWAIVAANKNTPSTAVATMRLIACLNTRSRCSMRGMRQVSSAPLMELSALRVAGLVVGAAVVAFAVWRRRSLRNADVLILFFAGLALAVVAATEITNALLEFFSFRKGGGGRILGLAVFAIFVMFILLLRNMALTSRVDRELSAVLEGIAWEEFRLAGLPEHFRDKVAVVIPAYNEEDNIGSVLPRIPATVCGVETAVLVVDDGSRDRTGDIAREHGAAVARHVINRGGGAALRTGYRLTSDSNSAVVVTLDADGQHLPEEMSRLVRPVLDGEIDVAHGSRVLGHAAPNHLAREMGIVFFNRVVSFITRTRVSDCSNGYRAVRASVLPQLVLRQEQFHTSEFMIEAIKRGVPAREIPVTVVERLHGHSKKPAVVRYGLGFANAIVRTWLR